MPASMIDRIRRRLAVPATATVLLAGGLGLPHGWAQEPAAAPVRPPSAGAIDAVDATGILPTEVPPLNDEPPYPIDWPTALELARGSNADVRLARERLHEAAVQHEVASLQWLPSLEVGIDYRHHEGRIQDIPGDVFDASKSSLLGGTIFRVEYDPSEVCIDVLRARQQQVVRSGELENATRQTLRDVSHAYLDLVAAQGGAAISVELERLIGELVERSQKLEQQGYGTLVEVYGNQAQQQIQRQRLNEARQKQLGASSQLAQLLDLEPGTRLLAADRRVAPLQLIDERLPERELIRRALSQGPGIQQTISLIATLAEQKEKLRRLNLMPTLEVEMAQGAFGGGTGSTLADFDGSADMGVRLTWDALRIIGTSQQRELFDSKQRQAMLRRDQLEVKLGGAVVLARDAATKASERIELAEREVELAKQAYELSNKRLQANETRNGSVEVLQAIGMMGQAWANYLSAVIAYDKAQVDLQYLIGEQSVPAEASRVAPGSPPLPHRGSRMCAEQIVEIHSAPPCEDCKPTRKHSWKFWKR